MKLIDKEKVIEKINSVLDSYDPNEITSGRYELAKLRDFLDTLEVKEVNLEVEDVFIEKAWNWIDDNILSSNQRDKSRLYFEQFVNYMKGE